MKQYEYAIEYVVNNAPYKDVVFVSSYEDAMARAIHLHNNGVKEVKVLRRLISEWKPIHQSKFSGA